MNIVELVEKIGHEKIGVQRLSNVLDGEQRTRKGGVTVFKFAAQQDLGAVTIRGTKDALILWVDTADLDAALNRTTEPKARSENTSPVASASPEGGSDR